LAPQPQVGGTGCGILLAQRTQARIQRIFRCVLELGNGFRWKDLHAHHARLGRRAASILASRIDGLICHLLSIAKLETLLARAARGGAVRAIILPLENRKIFHHLGSKDLSHLRSHRRADNLLHNPK